MNTTYKLKPSIFYFIDDEMVWAFAKEAMEDALARQEQALEDAQVFVTHVMENAPNDKLPQAREATQLYLQEVRYRWELRQQVYKRFMQWYEEMNDARDE